nr:hypothetical protein [uncultured Campylobacter sp.]
MNKKQRLEKLNKILNERRQNLGRVQGGILMPKILTVRILNLKNSRMTLR